jgi:DNA repair protein RadA/Sms
VGGIRATEPAVDLAVAAGLIFSFTDQPVKAGTVIFGEVGLAGEVRRVARSEIKMKEAVRLGFTRIISPALDLDSSWSQDRIKIYGISNIGELQGALFGDLRK